MSGFAAGIVSIATLLVGASILATLLKNPQGTAALIGSSTTGFSNLLIASQGNVTSLSQNSGYY